MDQRSVDYLTSAGIVEDTSTYKEVKAKLLEKEKIDQGRSYSFRTKGGRPNGPFQFGD